MRFRQDAEASFDDHMERLSGVYRRWSQSSSGSSAASLVVALNANTLPYRRDALERPSKRAAIVAQAARPHGADARHGDINDLPLPIGWSDKAYHGIGWLWALVGVLLTLGAVSLGAPFWFDTLSRFSRIRQTGTPPPASNATRGGEGDQERTLPGSVVDWTPVRRPRRRAANGCRLERTGSGADHPSHRALPRPGAATSGSTTTPSSEAGTPE